jgi:transcriptional regulator with XRE-family HTH domain
VSQPSLAQLGAAIRTLREKRGLTAEALAAETELHVVSVSRIENGRQNPTWIALLSIADVLDVEMIDLIRLAATQPASGTAGAPD